MTSLCQGNRTITEFYQAVYQHLSLILDKVSCLDLGESSLHTMTNTYREKALDTFIRGLNGDLPRLLSIREPNSLPQALHICLKLDNMTFRTNYANGRIPRANGYKDGIGTARSSLGNGKFYPELAHASGVMSSRPPLPPRYNNNPNFKPNYHYQNMSPTAYQNLGSKPQFDRGRPPNQQNQTQYWNRTPNIQRQTRVEPMDIDQSIQTRQANYINRPQDNTAFKRQTTASFQGPVNKLQRNFHINANYTPEELLDCGYPPEGSEENQQPENGEPDYVQEYFQHIPEEAAALENEENPLEEIQYEANFLD